MAMYEATLNMYDHKIGWNTSGVALANETLHVNLRVFHVKYFGVKAFALSLHMPLTGATLKRVTVTF